VHVGGELLQLLFDFLALEVEVYAHYYILFKFEIGLIRSLSTLADLTNLRRR